MPGSVEKMKRNKTRPKAYAVRSWCIISGDSLNLGQFPQSGTDQKFEEKKRGMNSEDGSELKNTNLLIKSHKRGAWVAQR